MVSRCYPDCTRYTAWRNSFDVNESSVGDCFVLMLMEIYESHYDPDWKQWRLADEREWHTCVIGRLDVDNIRPWRVQRLSEMTVEDREAILDEGAAYRDAWLSSFGGANIFRSAMHYQALIDHPS